MDLNEQLAGMVAPHSLLETAMRRLMESGFWDETRVNRDKGRFAPKGTAGQRDLFGDELKPETPEPERFENLGGRQQNLFGKRGLPGQRHLFADAGVPDDMVAKPAEIVADSPKIGEPLKPEANRKATFRWLAREVAKANGSNWGDSPRHWIEKAKAIAGAERTPEGVHKALMNFDWMRDLDRHPMSKRDRETAEAILKALEGREFSDEIPKP